LNLPGYPSLKWNEISTYLYKPIIGGRLLGGPFGAFWFVTYLFLTQQLMNFLVTKFSCKKMNYIMLAFIVISSINSYRSGLWLPWNAHVVFASSPFFYIGYSYQKNTIKFNPIILFSMGILVLLFSSIYQNNIYDMKFTRYGYPIITLFSSIILILNFKNLAIYITKIKQIEKVLSSIGKASLIIMFLHQPFQILIKTYYTHNNNILFCASISLSYLFYFLFSKSKLTKKLFLGKE